MPPLIRLAFPASIVLAMAACQQQSNQTPLPTAQVHVIAPSNPTDTAAWEDYMVKVSHADLKQVTAKPYLFEVLAANDPRAHGRNAQMQQVLTEMAKTNRFPGNAIAVGGPDPSATADVAIAAFGAAKPDSLKGLHVLYIGDENDQARVMKIISTSGAEFHFAKM